VTPPPIRYPLPTLVALIALVLILRYAAVVTRPLQRALVARWTRVIEGPPVPSSTEPKVLAGPITRRVLLLKDGVVASVLPNGAPIETIGKRMFADIYDVWPLAGPRAFYRIGNRRPFGWVPAAAALPWDTRLTVSDPETSLSLASTAEESGSTSVKLQKPSPVLAWTTTHIQVAVWDRERPWEAVERIGWVRASDVPESAWGTFLSRDELLAFLRRLLNRESDESLDSLRLRAVLGRTTENVAFSKQAVDAARSALPAVVCARQPTSREASTEQLSRINEQWSAEAAWSSLEFRAIPLSALP
jgi:hypothetical protein